jgi:predicted RNase H-like HicB family nuclease
MMAEDIDTSKYTYWVRSKEDGTFEGLCDQLPSLRCPGETREEAMANVREQGKRIVHTLLENARQTAIRNIERSTPLS